jgi:hypothetical protein
MRQVVFLIKQPIRRPLGLSDLLGKVSTGNGRNDDGRLSIQQLADGLDPEDEGNEPGQDERVSGEVLISDIEFCGEEYKQENNGQGQEGNERFHFCDFAVLEKRSFFCATAYAFTATSFLVKETALIQKTKEVSEPRISV